MIFKYVSNRTISVFNDEDVFTGVMMWTPDAKGWEYCASVPYFTSCIELHQLYDSSRWLNAHCQGRAREDDVKKLPPKNN